MTDSKKRKKNLTKNEWFKNRKKGKQISDLKKSKSKSI